MRAIVLMLNTFVVLLLAGGCTSLVAAEFEFKYPRSSVDMRLQQDSEHVWFVRGATGVATDNEGFISNASVIIDRDEITIVDSLGSPALAEKLVSLVREISDLPIARVIVTHYHADHIYGLQVFEELGAEIVAPYGVHAYLNSQAAVDRLEERRFSLEPWVNEDTRLVHPDQLVKEATVLKGQDITMIINYLGKSHSDADLTIFVEPDRVFITGDVIFEGRIPFVGDSDSKAWLDTLNAMADQKGVKALIPGHGGLARKPEQAIALTRDYLAYLRAQLGAGVEQMMSFDELYQSIDWSPFEHLPAFGVGNRINAYQVFLALEKEFLAQ